MGKQKSDKSSKPIGYQDIRRLFGRATQATQATPAARPATRPRQQQPGAPTSSHAAAAPAAAVRTSKAAAGGAPPPPAAAAAAAGGAAPKPVDAGVKKHQRPAAGQKASSTTGHQQQQQQPAKLKQRGNPPKPQPAAADRPQQPAPAPQGVQKRLTGAPGSAAEAAAAHAAKAAAARAAKGSQAKEAATATGYRSAPERSVTPAADPAAATAAAALTTKSNGSSHSGSAASGLGGGTAAGQGANSKPSKLSAVSVIEGPAGAGGRAGSSSRGGAHAGVARGPVAALAAAADSKQQHRPASALFSNCMGLQAGGQMVMSQCEDMPEVQWEASPPKLALLNSCRAAHRAAAQSRSGHAAAAGSGAEGVRSGGGSGLGGERAKSRSKSHTPVSRLAEGQQGCAGAAGGSSGSEAAGRSSKGTAAPASKSRVHEGSGEQQDGAQGAAGGSKQMSAPGQHDKLDGSADDSDAVLQQVLASIAEPCAGPSVLATPGGPRLRAFKQHSVLPPSSGGGSSCRKLQRQQRRSSVGTAAALAAAAAATGAAVAGTPRAAAVVSAGAGGSGSTGSAARLAGVAATAAGAPTPGSGSTARKQQAGLKRKVLLELLEKVQDLVKKPRLDGSCSGDGDGEDSTTDGSHGALPVRQLLTGEEEGDAARDEAAAAAAATDAVADADADALLEAVLADVGNSTPRSRRAAAGTPKQQRQQQQQGRRAALTQQQQRQRPVSAGQQSLMPTQVLLPGTLVAPSAAGAAAAVAEGLATDRADVAEATQDPLEATLHVADLEQSLRPAPGDGTGGDTNAAPDGPDAVCGMVTGDRAKESVPATLEQQQEEASLQAGDAAAAAGGEGQGAAGTPATAAADPGHEQATAQPAAAAAAAAATDAAAADAVPGVPQCSQEGRARAAAKELEDFELLYGDVDDLLASSTQSQQQQQQQQEQQERQPQQQQQQQGEQDRQQQDGQQQQQASGSEDEIDLLDAVLADIELPAAKRQKLQQQQQSIGCAAGAAGGNQASGPHAVAVAAAAHATGQGAPSWVTPAAAAAAPSCNGGQAAAAASGGVDSGAAAADGVPPAVLPLAGGRAEVYHEVLEAVHGPAEVLLRCHNPFKGSELWVHLSHPWGDCRVVAGDRANIMGGTRTTDAEGRSHAYLDHGSGMFVLHPDVLLSGTAITTALGCVRRAWLSERFAAAGGGPGAAATRGTLLHELLQRLLVEVVGADADAELPGVEQLEKMVLDLLASSGEKLHEVGLTEEGAAREMNRHLANISTWLRQYLPQQQRQQPPPQQQQQPWQQGGKQQQQQPWHQGRQQGHQQQPWHQQRRQQQQHGRQLVMQPPPAWQQQQQQELQEQLGGPVDVGLNTGSNQRPRVLIRGVADIEENIWAPRYGLKGQLDASLLIQLTQPGLQAAAAAAARSGGVSGGGQQGSGGSSWAGGSSGGSWQQQQQQQHGPHGGWSGGGDSGRGWTAAGSGGGGSQASGGNRQQQEWQQWQQYQQHQQQQGRGQSWVGRSGGGGGTSGGCGRGVLAQVDLNQAAVGSGGSQSSSRVACSTVAGATAAAPGGAGAAAAATGGQIDGVKAYRGRVSGAAAAIRACTAGRAAGAAAQSAAARLQYRQQQVGQVRSLTSGGSRAQAAAASAAARPWSAGGQGQGSGGGWRSGGQQQQQQQQGASEVLIVPFEFKTGKDYFSHKAQVSLYLLLMEVRYQLGLPPAGLLWNVNSQSMVLVPAKQEELASLLSCRNRLAAHLWQECPPPPAMLGESHTCSRCHSAATCAAVHAVLEGGNADSSGMEPQQWQELAGGVGASAAAWGSKWVQLLDWEESGGRARRSQVWVMTGAQRQARGGCIAGLKLVKTTTAACSSGGAALAAADPAAAAGAAAADGEQDEEAAAAELEAVVAASQAASQQQQQQAGAAGVAGPPAADVAGGEGRLYLYTFEQEVQYQCINSRKARQQTPQQQQQEGAAAAEGGDACSGQRAPHEQQQQGVDGAAAGGNDSSSSKVGRRRRDGERTLQGIAASPGEMLLLSADGMQVNIGRVDVLEVSGSSITVASRKDLQLERYTAATAAAAGTDGNSGSNGGSSGSSVLWRLDQDEAASIGMHQRAAVLCLAADNTCAHVQRLRELIVDLAAPRLMDALQHSQQQQQQQDKPVRARSSSPQPVVRSLGQQQVRTGDPPADRAGSAPQAVTAAAPAAVAEPAGGGAPAAASPVMPAPFGAAARLAAASGESYLANHGAHLNSNQVAVLRRVMAMQDYCLVLGMPGTGKTSTIVHAIRALVSSGASVLVAAYTNSALDNILLKLADSGVHQFLRLGRAASCHARVRGYMPGGERYPHRSTSELQQLAASTPIVGCPCLSAHHPLLATRPPFDVVIVDEAGQITTPAVLPALLRGRSFVLVGDHYQLPPLVLDPRAQAGGLVVSLFRQLCEAHPAAVVKLRQQYRMAGPIMDLANALIYKGQLQAGSSAVAAAQLALPQAAALSDAPGWVSAALDPAVRLAFLDTDGIQPPAAAEDSLAPGGGVINTGEAQLLMQLLSSLLAAGVPGGDIGIISPYKAQVNHLQKLVEGAATAAATTQAGSSTPAAAAGASAATAAAGGGAGQVEVLTIDRCQGRDKPVMLLSFVRSNAKGTTGTLLTDAARLNVAITRAKVKLLMVGSGSRLRAGVPLLAQLLDWVQGQGCVMQLPADALGSS